MLLSCLRSRKDEVFLPFLAKYCLSEEDSYVVKIAS